MEDSGIYNALLLGMIASLILVSAGTFYFRHTLYARQDFFYEVFFTQPNDLPQHVEKGVDYAYTFGIRNSFGEPDTIPYSTGIELYNLYDVQEAHYSCLRDLRRKVYMEWTNDTSKVPFEMNPAVQAIEPLAAPPSFKRNINWSNYNLDVRFNRPTGKGRLYLYFGNNTDTKYYVLFDDAHGSVYLNEKLVYEGLNLSEGNNHIVLSVKNASIRVYWNDDELFQEALPEATNGAFGLYSEDAYFIIQRFLVYKDSPIVVPVDDTIIEYIIHDRVLWKKFFDLKSSTSRNVQFIRTFERYNYSINCDLEPFYCYYYGLENDISFYLDDTNLTRIAQKTPAEGINYRATPARKEEAVVPWSNFTIDFSYSSRDRPKGSLILTFGDKWGVIITDTNAYYMVPTETQTRIDEIRYVPLNVSENHINIHVTNDSIDLFINNRTIFSKQTPDNYTGGYTDVYYKSQTYDIDQIAIKNNDPVCEDPFQYEFCSITLQISSFQNPVEVEPEYTVEVNSYLNRTLNVTERQLSFPVSNPYISDRKVILDSASTRINASNFSFSYTYSILEGSRVVNLGFVDVQGNDITSMHILERSGTIIIFDNEKRYDFLQSINASTSHTLGLSAEGGKLTYYFDRKPLYTIDWPKKAGYLYAGSRNTYVDFTNPSLIIEGSRRPVRLPGAGCDLNLIFSQYKEGQVTLQPDSIARITSQFNINQDFDYGKIVVKVNDTQEIHFWVMPK